LASEPTREIMYIGKWEKERKSPSTMAGTFVTCHTGDGRYVHMILIFPPAQMVFMTDKTSWCKVW